MSAKTQRSEVAEQANTRAGERYARTPIHYTDEPLGKVQVVPDFLPSPDELAFREEEVKITLSLSRKSVEYFKSEAEKHHTRYQRMIRRLLDAYVEAHVPTSHGDSTQGKGTKRQDP